MVVADLSPFQLVLIGTFQSATVLAAEVPAGVLADSVSRRLALVVAHLVTGAGMVMTGFVTDFPLLVVSNCLWGMGWAFSSGADVAWITDELGGERAAEVDGVLAAQGRWELVGTVAGVVAGGALAWATSLSTAMIVAGAAMVALGVGVVARWPEDGYAPVGAERSWSASWVTLRRGLSVARRDRVVLALLVATALLNGSSEGYGRLYERRLVRLGMPTSPEPIVWFTLLGVAAAVLGVLVLRSLESQVDGPDVARRSYVWSCGFAAAALVVFAVAPSIGVAAVAALAVKSVAAVPRVTSTIRLNRRTESAVRATTHSLLSWSENLGEILCGLGLALVAGLASTTVAILGSAVLLVAAGAVGNIDGD